MLPDAGCFQFVKGAGNGDEWKDEITNGLFKPGGVINMKALFIICLSFIGVLFVHDDCLAADRLSWQVKYDDQDRISQRIDPSGRVTQYSYTPAAGGPLQQITVTPPEGAAVSWRLDGDEKLASMRDRQGEVAYRYDSRGRLESIERKGAPAIRYAYDVADRLAELRVGDFYRIAWSYDFLGRITALDTPAGPIRYEYWTGQSTVVRTLPNNVKTFWKRKPNGEMVEISHGFFKNPKDTSYSLLAEYKYSHGPDGRIAMIKERSGQGEHTRRYTYDKLGRLTDATGPGDRIYHYEYDPVGNRTRANSTGLLDQISSYDWAGRLTTVNGKPCQYDESGNLTEVSLDGEKRQYRYHPDGRLAEATVGGESVQYHYDGFGRLATRKTASGETHFIPNPLSPYWQPLVIEEPGGERTLIVWDRDTPMALIRNGKVEWLLHDHLGSVRLVTDAKGDASRYCDYDPYGVSVGTGRSETPAPGFAGLFWDTYANGYLVFARVYLSKFGGFPQPDLVKLVPSDRNMTQGIFAYCGGDPINYKDIDGKEPEGVTFPINYDDDDFKRYPLFQYALVLGLGSGADATLESGRMRLLKEAQGRFQIIDVTASGPNGWGSDIFEYAFTNGQQWNGQPRLATWKADIVLKYSAGAHLVVSGAIKVFLADPSSQRALAQKEITLPGVVSGLTALEFQRVSSNAVGIGFRVKFDNPKEAMIELGGDVVGVAKGTFIVAENIIRYGEPFYTHKFANYSDKLDELQPEGTYNYTQLVTREGVYHYESWRLVNFTSKPIDPPITGTLSTSSGKLAISPIVDLQQIQEPKGLTNPIMKQIGAAQSVTKHHDVAGPGGKDSPGAYAALPSPVGGIYLGGASGAVNGLGVLKGVRTDTNGNLVLIGEGDNDVKLPPLRLDDVVTVFRSVYLFGEGPTVTIDPNPENPEKSAMIIRHGKATEETYVGWVLYQADRLMKSYGQGVDNKTQKDVVTRVPGYDKVLETVYFGTQDPRKAQKDGIWERFWIVPAAARRFDGPRRELTLFDVPLKVKTQKMKWEKDKLVDDKTGKSSIGALAFTSWFTGNYDSIAAEQYLTPPTESGITGPVPVFTELRQIALLTAVAEKLRDQGVVMPFWMRDYEVRRVPFEQTTPGMEVTRKRKQGDTIQSAHIFGGVQLSPDSKAVMTYGTAADVAKAPNEIRPQVDLGIKLADHLEHAVAEKFSPVASAPLTLQRVAADNRAYQAVSVPGADTLALGPCRLNELDIVVPIPGGQDIRLVRSFNSFFEPKGPWGNGWTPDFPRLQEIRVPINREGDQSTYAKGFELLTPLNSFYARFRNVRPVPELNGAKILVPDTEGAFLGLVEKKPAFLNNVTTRVLLLKDGQEWYFTEYGDLLAVKNGPHVTAYERAPMGQITRIVAMLGGQLAGQINLEYTPDGGRLTKAVGALPDGQTTLSSTVTYAYDDSNHLTGVTLSEGKTGYIYAGPRVSAITWQGTNGSKETEVLRSFQYDANGRLQSEKNGDTTIVHAISAEAKGLAASSQGGQKNKTGSDSKKSVTRYDLRMRPTETVAADGTLTSWIYSETEGQEMIVTTPDKKSIKIIESPDGRKRTVTSGNSPEIMAEYDSGGRLCRLTEGGHLALAQMWRPDGQLFSAESATQSASFNYDNNGLLSTIMLHPAKTGKKLEEWQETKLDRIGRPIEVADYSGLKLSLGYDKTGNVASTVQKTPEGNFGYNVKRDDEGRIAAVAASWGDTTFSYNPDGYLKRVVDTRAGQSATVEFSGGRIQAATGFDGGRTSFGYQESGPAAGVLRTITCPNGLKLDYDYAPEGDLSAIKVGKDRRVRLSYDKKGRMTDYAWEPGMP
jgi:RHS repeat-associated protein